MANKLTPLESIIAKDSPIIPAHTAVETFRDSGYRSTATAMSELIDNSIEAGAKNIQVITFEDTNGSSRRIEKIAVYDDGDGMSPETLLLSLQFAVGTRMKGGKGIGRFGIGLPNASVSQCRRVEVYSWQEKNKCFMTYLDIDEIQETLQQNANMPQECDFPQDVINEIGGEAKKSGTIIVWSKCDRLDLRRPDTLYRRMEKSLCRVYRHFLDNDDSYGKKVNMVLKIAESKEEPIILKANDPLYLLTPNNTPEYGDKATNILHCDPISIVVPYNGEKSTVEMRFSIALPEIQELGGGSELGQHYKGNTGISFVRACREIDFGNFNFFNPHDERERWWGCEIRFEPALDELFGVSNNKQSLRRVRYIDKENEEEYADDKSYFFLMQEISKYFSNNIKTIRTEIQRRGKGKRSGAGGKATGKDKSVQIANQALQSPVDKSKTEIEGKAKSEEQIKKDWLQSLENEIPKLDEADIQEIIRNNKDNKIHIDFTSFPGDQFFTIETRGKTQVILMNKNHPFFAEVYEPLSGESSESRMADSRISDAIDLLMMAYARTEDELYDHPDVLEKIRSRWGLYVTEFLREMKKADS